MVLDFFLPWSRLNFFFLSFEKQDELASVEISLQNLTYFKYRKIEKRY